VGFEPTIQAFEQAKKVHALDPAAMVIGNIPLCTPKIIKEPGAKSTQEDMNAEKGRQQRLGLVAVPLRTSCLPYDFQRQEKKTEFSYPMPPRTVVEI
jgi:hypothetical protein